MTFLLGVGSSKRFGHFFQSLKFHHQKLGPFFQKPFGFEPFSRCQEFLDQPQFVHPEKAEIQLQSVHGPSIFALILIKGTSKSDFNPEVPLTGHTFRKPLQSPTSERPNTPLSETSATGGQLLTPDKAPHFKHSVQGNFHGLMRGT